MNEASRLINVGLTLSPEGRVYLDTSEQVGEKLSPEAFTLMCGLFAEGGPSGLLQLGIQEISLPLSPSFLFWQSLSRHFVAHVCKHSHLSDEQGLPNISVPKLSELQEFVDCAPCIRGVEYLNIDVLLDLWNSLFDAFRCTLEKFGGAVQEYLSKHSPRWNLLGRVCFHLAENKNDEARPFAFLATYTTKLSEDSSARHLPLRRALEDYAGEKNKAALLSLLRPVQKAANQSSFIQGLVDSGAIFQTLAWSPQEAHRFLRDISVMESSGVVVRVPNWWNNQAPPRPKVQVQIGQSDKSMLGLSSLLDFDMHLALGDGEALTHEELLSMLSASGDLIKVKGQWVEIDRQKLQEVLKYWNNVQKVVKDGLTMAQGLRLISGLGLHALEDDLGLVDSAADWSAVVAGDWLKDVLQKLRSPQVAHEKKLEQVLNQYLVATLRPYQMDGVQWLWLLYQLRLGGCLADDMGLGKTIQVLALCLLVKHHTSLKVKKPHLLVVPASLIGNWQAEASRFAPTLNILIAHSSARGGDLAHLSPEELDRTDIVITTYAYLHRLKRLEEIQWDLLILDEAQQIKNPGTKQTRAVKQLKSQVRLTLTGTPIENRLGDLWSLFDFTSPGLLGTSKAFSDFIKKVSKGDGALQYSRFVSTLRHLTQPYILRRLKSDKKIICDLPDKTEVQTFCGLSKEQTCLYEQSVTELKRQLQEAKGIQRRGIVLSYLMRFKQICNHPTQWLGYGDYAVEKSGKFMRLREICEEIAAKQEKVLIFTQFREIIPAIAAMLTQVFGCEGLTLSGETAVGKRAELVASFQQEQGPPFFVLSLKAGGTGLNLTRASHVIHFDRWWNPAVENQATDRAYRIGQKHPVLVHKFICQGTIEEKIDALITSKKQLAEDLLEGDGEVRLTELTDEELINIITLDLNRAIAET